MDKVTQEKTNNILIVDDDFVNVEFIYHRLKKLYNIKKAYNGKEAIDILEKEAIDLILLDIEMPILNGFEVAKIINSNEKLKDIPFLFLTARNDCDETFVQCFELGAKDYINKPFKPRELEIRIKTHLTSFLQKKELEATAKKLKDKDNTISNYLLFSETNLNGIITYASDAFCTLSGYTRDELIGSPHNLVRHQDMDSNVFKDLWATIKQGKTWKGEIKNRAKNGHYYWVDATISPNYDESNNLIGYISIRQEITAKKDHEQQQLRLYEEAKMSSLGELLTNIAHHWRQPLSVITTTASGMQLEQEYGLLDEKKIQDYSKNIIDQCNFLSNTINEISAFFNKQSEYIQVTIQDEINSAISVVKNSTINKTVKIISNINETKDIQTLMVSNELPKVLINILNNASEIQDERKVENKWIKLDLLKQNNTAIISIEDNGGGIKNEDLPYIFDPYFTTKHKSKGKGLALYMSYKIIIDVLKGKLYAQNTNNGAKFIIEIPL